MYFQCIIVIYMGVNCWKHTHHADHGLTLKQIRIFGDWFCSLMCYRMSSLSFSLMRWWCLGSCTLICCLALVRFNSWSLGNNYATDHYSNHFNLLCPRLPYQGRGLAAVVFSTLSICHFVLLVWICRIMKTKIQCISSWFSYESVWLGDSLESELWSNLFTFIF